MKGAYLSDLFTISIQKNDSQFLFFEGNNYFSLSLSCYKVFSEKIAFKREENDFMLFVNLNLKRKQENNQNEFIENFIWHNFGMSSILSYFL